MASALLLDAEMVLRKNEPAQRFVGSVGQHGNVDAVREQSAEIAKTDWNLEIKRFCVSSRFTKDACEGQFVGGANATENTRRGAGTIQGDVPSDRFYFVAECGR